MSTPSDLIIQLLCTFRTACTQPTFIRLCTLATGAILAPGQRTVAAALRAVGLENVSDFSNYHEVFNRARWSPLIMSRLLLGLIVSTLLAAEAPLLLVIDDTLERRRGRKVRYKSIFRDAVRSTAEHLSLTFGIRWVCACVLVETPWSQRPWALPFFVIPVISEKRALQLKKRYVSPTQWAAYLLKKVRRWFPDRPVVLIGDGGYASVELSRQAADLAGVTFVSRLRMDAALYDAPALQPKNKRGPKPKKGARQPGFSERLENKATVWRQAQIRWYGGRMQEIEYATGVSLWHKSNKRNQGDKSKQDPVTIRWVLVRCPTGSNGNSGISFPPAALFCTDTEVPAQQIVQWFLWRWNIEVTFEEMRACLGFETQRHWSDKAVGRVTPCLFGLFSIVVLLAHRLCPKELPVHKARWYDKQEPSFRDALAAVRIHLMGTNLIGLNDGANYSNSANTAGNCVIPIALLRLLQRTIAYAS
jgi:hypothetical protein